MPVEIKPNGFHSGSEIERLIQETAAAIENTRRFLSELTESDGPAKEQIGTFVIDLEERLDRLTQH